MFSVVYVVQSVSSRMVDGFHITTTHDAFYLNVQGPPLALVQGLGPSSPSVLFPCLPPQASDLLRPLLETH